MITIKKGFTLIELLVVIAIIAILAAILFPVFNQALEKANAANCLSNMKQLGTAMQLYVDDWDETYPYGAGGDWWGWASKIIEYAGIKNDEKWHNSSVFQCPSDPYKGAYHESRLGRNSYCANSYLCESIEVDWNDDGRLGPMKLSEVDNPAQRICLAETWRTYMTLVYCPKDLVLPPFSPFGDGGWSCVFGGDHWVACD